MLYECHGHIFLHHNDADSAGLRKTLKGLADDGVFYYRDGGDPEGISLKAKAMAKDFGIDFVSPAFAIYKAGYYGKWLGRAFETQREFHALVREAADRGADYIKIMATGILDFNDGGKIHTPALKLAELTQMLHVVHEEGFAAMVHVNGPDHILDALEAGADSIEHGYWPSDKAVDAFLHSGAIWVPTRAPIQNLVGSGRVPDDVLKTILYTQGAVLRQAYASGVPVASGSDAGALMVPQGQGTEDEIQYLRQLGIDCASGNLQVAKRFRRK